MLLSSCRMPAPLPTLRKGDEAIINTISSAIVQALPLIQVQAYIHTERERESSRCLQSSSLTTPSPRARQDAAQTPEDVLRLGMGLGIHLQSAGIIEEVKRTAAAPEPGQAVKAMQHRPAIRLGLRMRRLSLCLCDVLACHVHRQQRSRSLAQG